MCSVWGSQRLRSFARFLKDVCQQRCTVLTICTNPFRICQASTSFMFGLRIIAVVSVEAGPPDCTLAIRLSDLAKPKEFLRAGKSVETSTTLSRTQGSQGSSIKIQLGSVWSLKVFLITCVSRPSVKGLAASGWCRNIEQINIYRPAKIFTTELAHWEKGDWVWLECYRAASKNCFKINEV
jgi:hypothetical protein